MQPSKTLFFAIIGLAIVIVIGMFLARLILAEPLDLPTGNEAIEIQLLVAPSIKPWIDRAARSFNQANPRTQVRVVAANDLTPEGQFQTTNPAETLPAAWIAEASFVVDMARNQGVRFDEARSVASTGLAWGSFNSKLDQFNQAYGPLTWASLNAKGTSGDRLQVVIASPQNSAEGLAAFIAATAGNRGTTTLTANDISAADAWLTQTFGNRNTRIAATPAEDFATKGVSAGDFGLLSLASWEESRLDERSDFTITPTEPNVSLDYPFAIWSGSQPAEKAAAVAFRNYLLAGAQQDGLADFSLDPAATAPNTVQVDGVAAQRLLDWANRQLR
jgi:hypothetical protein